MAGSLALIAGLVAAVLNKGGKQHIRFGRYFMWMIIIVIVTGLFGIFLFKRNNFLLVITMLSGPKARAHRLYGPVIAMASAFYYLYYIYSLGLYWSPVIIYLRWALYSYSSYLTCLNW